MIIHKVLWKELRLFPWYTAVREAFRFFTFTSAFVWPLSLLCLACAINLDLLGAQVPNADLVIATDLIVFGCIALIACAWGLTEASVQRQRFKAILKQLTDEMEDL